MAGPDDIRKATKQENIKPPEQNESREQKVGGSQEVAKPRTPDEINTEVKRVDAKIAVEQTLLNKARQALGLSPTDTSLAIESLRKQRQELLGEQPQENEARREFKFSQMAATFFRERESLARDVDNLDGARRYDQAGSDFRKLREKIPLQNPSELLATLTNELQRDIDYRTSGRDIISPEFRPNEDERFRQARAIFSEVGKQLFPDVPGSPELMLRNVQSGVSQVSDPVLNGWVTHFRTNFKVADAMKLRDSNPTELLRQVDGLINNAAIDIETARLSGSSEAKKDIVDVSRAVFALESMRQDLEARIAGKTMSQSEQPKVEPARASAQRSPEKTEQVKQKAITFKEAYDKLFAATTIEQVRAAMTPEIVEAAKTKILTEIDGAIDQAEHLVTTRSEYKDGLINKKSTANVYFGIQGNEGGVFQKIGIAKFGRVMSSQEMAVMPIVDFMKTFFDYDLEKDTARAEKLKKYTNAFM